MATFLTTPKMDPALAARIDASVRGRRGKAPGGAFGPGLVAVARGAALVAIVVVVASILVARHRDKEETERERAALLADVGARGASMTPDDKGAVARAESWLVRFAGAYEGDLVDDALRAPGAFAAILARPAVYVRGPIANFTGPALIAEAAAVSAKDPLLLCLVAPPPSRAEKVLLGKVRAGYAGGPLIEQPTSNVRRLHDAEVGLPLLLPPWSDRVRSARDATDLARLRSDLERAPIERAKEAATAKLLLFAMDEPGTSGPTELDGERPHDIRIGLVDLAAARVLLRIKKHVDPSWITASLRADYAMGLDSCALAFDVHAWVSANPR